MLIPSFQFGYPLHLYAMWTLISFFSAFVINSFFEFIVHRFFLHKRAWPSYPYEKHAKSHHVIFGGDDSYHAHDDFARSHITFTAFDYLVAILGTLPFWILAEFAVGRPIIGGCFLATLAYLQVFNSLHLRWHLPSDTWFQRTRLFLWMKGRHKIHHGDHAKNLNLVVPIADLLFGTFARPSRSALPPGNPSAGQ